jgi:hypothetical protein
VFECPALKSVAGRFVGVPPSGDLVEDVDVVFVKWSAHLGTSYFLGVAAARRNGQVIVEADRGGLTVRELAEELGVSERFGRTVVTSLSRRRLVYVRR